MRTAILRSLLWLAATGVVLVLVAQFAPSLLLPGQVTRGHAKFETQCFQCHQPFLGPREALCVECHSVDKIKAARPAMAAFHRQIIGGDCLACHTDHKGADPAAATNRFEHSQLTGDPADNCQACHASPKGALHQTIKVGCGACHGTAGWGSANFEHSAFFRFDRHHPADCGSCHLAKTYATYTCYGCHKHSEGKIRREHLKEGIRDYIACEVCHRSGSEHEAKRRWRELRRRGLTPSEAARAGGLGNGGGYKTPGTGAGSAAAPDDDDHDDDDEKREKRKHRGRREHKERD